MACTIQQADTQEAQCSARVSQLYPYVSGGNPFEEVEYDFPKK